jgi:hypothetical protein
MPTLNTCPNVSTTIKFLLRSVIRFPASNFHNVCKMDCDFKNIWASNEFRTSKQIRILNSYVKSVLGLLYVLEIGERPKAPT